MRRLVGQIVLIITVVMLLAGLLLVGCSAKPSEVKEITMRYSAGLTKGDWLVRDVMPLFAKKVLEKTGGKVKLELYPDSVLYTSVEGTEAVSTGAIDIHLAAMGHWSGRNPVFGFNGYYFTVTNGNQWLKAEKDVMAILDPLYEKQNAKVINSEMYGAMAIFSKVPINVPADMKGKLLRAPDPALLTCIQALGATPASVAPAEVYDAMAKGAIHGGAAGFSTIYSRKYQEIAKYALGTTNMAVFTNFMSLTKWKSLTKEVQQAFMDAGKEVTAYTVEKEKQESQKYIDMLKKEGVTVTLLTPEQEKVWADNTKPAFEEFYKQCKAKGTENEGRKLIGLLEAAR